ncbi:MAG: type VI secretion system contractile sheath large subunit, partial [Deltaproteobacteria bacterium]|nr:type VI secretion system contractile sheath large subunit [Deltaproteobacteria bacterium]
MSQRQQQQAVGESIPAPNLLEAIIKETNLTPTDEGYEAARLGIGSFISEMLKPSYQHEKVKKTTVDRMIAEIDYRMGRQIDEILHDKDFQALESAWLG